MGPAPRLIYFAGSISAGREDTGIYAELVGLLQEHGSVLTEHVADANIDALGEPLAEKEVHDRDLDWLAKADALVAEVTIPSLGVGYEISKAEEWGKPVLCLYREGGKRLSAMISGSERISCRTYTDLAEAAVAIERFFAERF
jgi:hypothetical protein